MEVRKGFYLSSPLLSSPLLSTLPIFFLLSSHFSRGTMNEEPGSSFSLQFTICPAKSASVSIVEITLSAAEFPSFESQYMVQFSFHFGRSLLKLLKAIVH